MFPLKSQYQLNFTSSRGEYRDIISPNDLVPFTKVQFGTAEDADKILSLVKSAQEKMRAMPSSEKIRILKAVAQEIGKNADQLALLIAREGGKPLKDAIVEVTRAKDTFELCAEECWRLHGETIPMDRTESGKGHLNFTTREPIGPVLAISAFNHPLNNLAHQTGPAIAAGNMIVLKPASGTPVTAFVLEEMFRKAGLPPECLMVFTSSTEHVEKLFMSGEFAFVNFIGSAKVGWEMRRKIPDGVRISMEHGGQAAAILREDADLREAIPQLIRGSFYHAGQVCISTQRIFVHRNLFEVFKNEFVQRAKKLKTGTAMDDTTDVGPLIRPEEVVRVKKDIDEAIKRGAKLLAGNEIQGNVKQYLTPTILADVPRDTSIMMNEAFGPVVCLNSYEDEEELVKYLNSNKFPFESCLYTKDIKAALTLSQKISTMTLVVNNHNAFRVDWMPFGGHGLAGLGLGGVKYAMEEMTRLKQVIIKI
ncbi:MAG: aldehyde dehydrogenase family protein [Bdellovibrionota bacterium]